MASGSPVLWRALTLSAIIAGLLPILWGQGAGASVMKRIAAPMVGGMIASALLTLIVIPAVYSLWRQTEISRSAAHPSAAPPAPAPANT